MWQRTVRFVCVWGVLVSAGCGKETLVPVSGKVTLDGNPLTKGMIYFASQDEKNRPEPRGTIGADGTYDLATNGQPGAPPGKYVAVITVEEKTEKAVVPVRYTIPNKNPLTVEVSAGASPGAYDLKLTSK
jgi:hypothetical protein